MAIQIDNSTISKRDLSGGQWGKGTVDDAHKQWASRPADEQVHTLDELIRRTHAMRDKSRELKGVPWKAMTFEASLRGDLLLCADGTPLKLTNYATEQLCSLPSADGSGNLYSAAELCKLRTETAAMVLNERLTDAGVGRANDASLLLRRNGVETCAAVLTDKYERVWLADDADCVASLANGSGWGPFEAFKRADGDNARGQSTSKLPLAWLGERDMFVCLANYEPIEHKGSTYSRFMLLSDSEVGYRARKIVFGYFDYACCNFILWGCVDVFEASFKHSSSIHDRIAELNTGMAKQLSADNTATFLDGIDWARATILADTKPEVVASVRKTTALPKQIVEMAYDTAEQAERYGDPRSAWGMINGLTEVSQKVTTNADKRVEIDSKAALLMPQA